MVIEEKIIHKWKVKLKSVIKSALDLIGNTPIIKLQKIVPENAAEVWLKYEEILLDLIKTAWPSRYWEMH